VKGLRIWLWGLFVSLFAVVLPVVAQDFQGFNGRIDNDTPYHEHKVIVYQTGATIIADIRPVRGDAGGNLDTLLILVDDNNNIVAENDDRVRKVDKSSRIEFPEAQAGEYTVIATRYGVDRGKTAGDYRLTIQVVAPERIRKPNYDYDVSDEALLAAGYPATAPRPKADWTVLVYYGGDNNLEQGIIDDYREFQAAGGSDDVVQIVALVDVLSDNKARLYDLTDLDMTTLDGGVLAEFPAYESGEGLNFAQFMVWGIRNFPAERYVVAMASHGAGWRGIITDDPDENSTNPKYDILTLPELRAAYRLAMKELPQGKRFELIINDACLMSSVEYHHAMAEFFDYSLASPEIVITPAHDMTLFANVLKENTEATVPIVGQKLIDAYINRDVRRRPTSDIVYFTSALTDLTRFGAVYETVERFANLINVNAGNYSALLSNVRNNAYVYTAFSGDDQLIDLGHFMRGVVQNTNDPDIVLAAQEIISALDETLIEADGGDVVRNTVSNYQNIYFPSSSRVFDAKYFEESGMPRWGAMLRNFYNAVTPSPWLAGNEGITFHPPLAPVVRIFDTFPAAGTTVSTYTPFISKLEIVARNLSYVNATVDLLQADGEAVRYLDQRILRVREVDGVVRRINEWTDGIATSEGAWDVTLPFVFIGTQGNVELLRVSETVAALDGRYRTSADATWNDVTLIFSVNQAASGGEFQRAINRTAETGAVADVQIPLGSTFQSYRSVVTPDGRTVTEDGNIYEWTEALPTWRWSPAPSGEYNVGFLATASGGTTGFDSVRVTVDNSRANPNLRSFTNTFLLVSVARPSEWTTFTEFEDGYFRSLSPQGGFENITIYNTYDVFDGELNATADSIFDLYGLSETGERLETTVNGKPALDVRYTYTQGETTRYGHGYVLSHDVGEGFIVGYLVGASSTQEESNILEVISSSIVFYEPVPFCETPDCRSAWVRYQDVEGTFYNIPDAWSGGRELPQEEGDWVRYGDGSSFVAIRRVATIQTNPQTIAVRAVETVVKPDVPNVVVDDRRRFTGRNLAWNAAIYSGERDGVAVYGRMYALVTRRGEEALLIWVETPNDENTQAVVTQFIEPIVDAFVLRR
jgi:hypothetical protein